MKMSEMKVGEVAKIIKNPHYKDYLILMVDGYGKRCPIHLQNGTTFTVNTEQYEVELVPISTLLEVNLPGLSVRAEAIAAAPPAASPVLTGKIVKLKDLPRGRYARITKSPSSYFNNGQIMFCAATSEGSYVKVSPANGCYYPMDMQDEYEVEILPEGTVITTVIKAADRNHEMQVAGSEPKTVPAVKAEPAPSPVIQEVWRKEDWERVVRMELQLADLHKWAAKELDGHNTKLFALDQRLCSLDSTVGREAEKLGQHIRDNSDSVRNLENRQIELMSAVVELRAADAELKGKISNLQFRISPPGKAVAAEQRPAAKPPVKISFWRRWLTRQSTAGTAKGTATIHNPFADD